MIYAYDTGVLLPISSIYDTQMMLALVAAAKDMYEKAEQEMKDFKKEYGDFYSPISNDMNWYALNVVGRIQNKINDLYARGLDPLRNAQARAEIRSEMNKINPGDIALLKLSAANATEFLKNLSRLLAAGLYNPLYAQYEGPSLNEYSTLGENGLGVWNRMSPTPIQNTAEFGNPYFEGMKPNVHKESKNGIEYSVEAITMDDLRKIADSRFNDLVNTPQGLLMYKYFKDLTGNDTKAREMFNDTIAAGQDRRIYSKDDYEYNYFKQAELSLREQKMRQDLANADRLFALDMAKSGIKIDPITGRFVTQNTEDLYTQPMDQRLHDKNSAGRADALSNYQNLFITAILNHLKIIDDYNKERDASTLGYTIEKHTDQDMVPIKTTGGSMSPGYFPNTFEVRKPYIKNKNSEESLNKMKKNAENAQRNILVFEEILKNGPEALLKYGFVDKYGYPTKKYTKWMVKTYLSPSRLKTLSDDQKKETIHGVFNSLYSAGSLSNSEFKQLRTKNFADGDVLQLPGAGKGVKLIRTTTGKYRYSPVYESNALGLKVDDTSIEGRLDKWLLKNDIDAWVWNEDLILDYFLSTRSGEAYAISGPIVISRSNLEAFAKQYGYNINDVIKKQNLVEHAYMNDDGDGITERYYEIPATTDINNSGGFNYYRINQNVNQKNFGSSQSVNDRTDAQLQSVMN